MSFLLFAFFSFANAADPFPSCVAQLTGSGTSVDMTVFNDPTGEIALDSKYLPILAEQLKPLGYYGPAGEPLRTTLFLVDFEEGMKLTTPFTTVRLGLHLARGDRSEKIRFEHTYSHLDRAKALARAIVDLTNHIDLIEKPEVLTREMNLLRAYLMVLLNPEFDPRIDRRFVRGALNALLEAPEHAGYFASARSRSTFRGRRFSAYLLAKQILVKGFEKIPREVRDARVEELLAAYQPAGPLAPKPEDLSDAEVRRFAFEARFLLGRPLFVAIPKKAATGTALWFEVMVDRGARVADGGIFLPAKSYGELDADQRRVFDEPPTARRFADVLNLNPESEWLRRLGAEDLPADEESRRFDTSWRGRHDESDRPLGDPTSTAVGLPTAPSPSVGISVNNSGI